MIYLMQSNDKLKIGYSKNCKKRLKSLSTGNPDIILLSSKPGDRYDESNLHNLCKDYHVINEWFKNVPEVHKIFNEYDAWHEQSFNKFKSEIFYYSTTGFWKITHPKNVSFTIPYLEKYENLIKESNIIPEDVLEWYNYAVNLMEIYHIICWLSLPSFNLSNKINWKKNYKINPNTIYTIPYKEILSDILDEKYTILKECLTDLSDYQEIVLFLNKEQYKNNSELSLLQNIIIKYKNKSKNIQTIIDRLTETQNIIMKFCCEDECHIAS